MTRHTRNRQMVEISRLSKYKALNVRWEMGHINVSMASVYREPKVWNLDPNFHVVRVSALKVTSRKGTHHPRNNKRLIDKHNRLNNKEIYEQLNTDVDHPVYVVHDDDGKPYSLALTYKKITKTVYFYTFKQPHYTGEGRYFNRILGRTKYGERHSMVDRDLPEEYKGLFDSEGFRLVVDHGNGTHSRTY